MPVRATLIRPAGVLTQKLRRPLRSPVVVGRKRTSVVQLSPVASVTESAHVPPATTAKSAAFTLADAIPNLQKVKLPAPEFVKATLTGALVSPTCNDPKSTLAGAGDAVGPVAAAKDVRASAEGAPVVPAQAKAATAESTATSLRAWWVHTVGVVQLSIVRR